MNLRTFAERASGSLLYVSRLAVKLKHPVDALPSHGVGGCPCDCMAEDHSLWLMKQEGASSIILHCGCPVH